MAAQHTGVPPLITIMRQQHIKGLAQYQKQFLVYFSVKACVI